MKKGFISFLLAVVIILSLIPLGSFTVSAEAAFDTSDACVDLIKAEEGFVSKPLWDYAQYTVGYGTRCPDDKLEYYSKYGITEEEAVALLRYHLDDIETRLNRDLINKFQLNLTQNQFDALVSFSYNCGAGWIYNESDNLRRAILTGASENEIIYRFSRWCNAGGQIKTYILRRRLREANMYINGAYSDTVPENYGYVLYDANGGVSDPNVQGYDTNLTAQIIPTPTYEGYKFDGWYTEREGGTKVTVLDASTKNARLYAHWIDDDGNSPSAGTEEGVKITVTANEVNVRSGPGTTYTVTSIANTGDQFNITEVATGNGYTWGKFYAGWICLQYTNYDQVADKEDNSDTTQTPEEPKDEVPAMGTVTVSDSLRIRTGPSTGYAVAGYLKNGDRVEVLEKKVVGVMIWGRIEKGWISLEYVKLDEKEQAPAQPDTQEPPKTEEEPDAPGTNIPEDNTPDVNVPEVNVPETEKVTWTGTVKVNDFLRVRSGPGTSYAIAGYLAPNAKVEIVEKKTVNGVVWGKLNSGWISLDYVVLDVKDEPHQKLTGTVNVNEFLRIRTGPGTSYAVAGYLAPKDKVEILETKLVGGTKWGRISKGWISMDYVILDNQSGNTNTNVSKTKTVIADCLRVRSAAGTDNRIVAYLYEGAKVTILETKTVGGTVWGKISKGWISMDYVQ